MNPNTPHAAVSPEELRQQIGTACTCYLGDPDDATRDPEACAACDLEFWENPIYMIEEEA